MAESKFLSACAIETDEVGQDFQGNGKETREFVPCARHARHLSQDILSSESEDFEDASGGTDLKFCHVSKFLKHITSMCTA